VSATNVATMLHLAMTTCWLCCQCTGGYWPFNASYKCVIGRSIYPHLPTVRDRCVRSPLLLSHNLCSKSL